MVQSSTRPISVRESGITALSGRAPVSALQSPTLGEIDTVDDRLGVTVAVRTRMDDLEQRILGFSALIERIDERERRDGWLQAPTADARQRLNQRIGDVIRLIGLFGAEMRAELEGARSHLVMARQSARIEGFVASRILSQATSLTEAAS